MPFKLSPFLHNTIAALGVLCVIVVVVAFAVSALACALSFVFLMLSGPSTWFISDGETLSSLKVWQDRAVMGVGFGFVIASFFGNILSQIMKGR